MPPTPESVTPAAAADRFSLTTAPASARRSFAEEVARGLLTRPKTLPSRFFYDAEGSEIFEEICEQPEYYLTRAEREILAEHADAIAGRMPRGTALVELGSGSAEKTRLLIEAFLRRDGELSFVPIDISRSALEKSAEVLLERYPELSVHAVAAEYEAGIARIRALERQPVLVAWLGSSIGNLGRKEAAAFLGRIRPELQPEDRVLVGIDLRKDAETLEAAYDDARGVTARFNLNLLRRINRELGGGFDESGFEFRARYREHQGVVESHLVSRRAQRVRIEALDASIDFQDGETIHTENSIKYSQDEIEELAREAGLRREREWRDAGDRFSLSLFAALRS